MDNFSRRYYERELGAGIGPNPAFKEHFGYTEPFRRFVQREDFSPQANEIPNTMPSWMPGDDYLTNFRVGDPYTKIDQGFARQGFSVLTEPKNSTRARARSAGHTRTLWHQAWHSCVSTNRSSAEVHGTP